MPTVPAQRVFLSYSRTDIAVAQGLVNALEQQGVEVFWDDKIQAGADWQDVLEKELYRCDLLLVLIGSQGVSGWVKPEVGIALNRYHDRTRDEDFRIVPVLLGDTPRSVLPPFLSLFNATDVPEQMGASDTAMLVEKLRGDELIAPPASAADLCPYPGLAAYDESLQAFFFGRQLELFDVLEEYGKRPRGKPRRWLQLTGNSGVGKSSLLLAGVLPALKNGWLDTGNQKLHFKILDTMRPGENPVAELAGVLVRSGLYPVGAGDLLARLNQESTRLSDVFREIPDCGKGFFPLLPIDQFEELFTQSYRQPQQQRRFDQLIADALKDNEYPLYVASSMRSDFNEYFEQLPRLNSLRGDSAHKELAPITQVGLSQVVSGPAKLVGLQLDEGLAAEIVSKACFEPGSLPLTSNLLSRLYESRENGWLKWDRYKSLGGLGGALSGSAEELLLSLENGTFESTQSHKQAALNLLLALVEPGLGDRHTRRTISRARAWGSSGLEPEAADEIINRLAGQVSAADSQPLRLLSIDAADAVASLSSAHPNDQQLSERTVSSPQVMSNPQDRIDLIHETLLRTDQQGAAHFSLLYKEIERQADFLGRRTSLEARARVWKQQSDGLSLLNKQDLQQYLPHREGGDPVTREYLDESQREIDIDSRRQQRRLRFGASLVLLALGYWLIFPFDLGQRVDDFRQKSAFSTYLKELQAEIDQTGPNLPTMVSLKGGKYRRGSNEYSNAQPVREVTIKPFLMGSTEVTFRQYDSYLLLNGIENHEHFHGDETWGRNTRPMINVDQQQALFYAYWLSEWVTTDQDTYRCGLPTESEWEYAARAGTTTDFFWGDGNAADYAVFDELKTSPVGNKRPNDFGLHDTAGNVWEWVEDCFTNSYQAVPIDGSAHEESGCLSFVLRGGSFDSRLGSLRSSNRGNNLPDRAFNNAGFRVVCRPH